jgi:hypothetical protein
MPQITLTVTNLALALGNDPHLNYKRRELPWYGLWDTVLRSLEESQGNHICYLCPQYPVWLVEGIDDIRDPAQGPNSDDVEMEYAFDGSVTLAHQLATTMPSSPMSSSSLPSSPLAHKSTTGVSFPLVSAAQLRINTPPPRSVIPKESHRVTDFAILHPRVQSIRNGEPVIGDVIIPVVTEIKTYHRSDHNDEHPASIVSRSEGLAEAQDHVELQVQYLFSGMRQPSVIAIAAAGPFWRWCQFYKSEEQRLFGNDDNADFIPSSDVLDAAMETEWSEIYKIGSATSGEMISRIHTWVKDYISHPTRAHVRIL